MYVVYYIVSASTLCTVHSVQCKCDVIQSVIPYILPLFDKFQYLFRVSILCSLCFQVCMYILVHDSDRLYMIMMIFVHTQLFVHL